MPSPRDITGDLGKLREKGVLPKGETPRFRSQMLSSAERRMAPNYPGLLGTVVLLAVLSLQAVILGWLAAW